MFSPERYAKLGQVFTAVSDAPPQVRVRVLEEQHAAREAGHGRVRRCRCEPRR